MNTVARTRSDVISGNLVVLLHVWESVYIRSFAVCPVVVVLFLYGLLAGL